MSTRRKPDPNQMSLSQQQELLGKREDKNLVNSIEYFDVCAYCAERALQEPIATEWFNGQQLLTYMIHVRGPRGIDPSRKKMGDNAFRGDAGGGYTVSEKTISRALRVLARLGVLTIEDRGPRGNRYQIHFDWLAEIRSAGARKRAAQATVNTGQNIGRYETPCPVLAGQMSRLGDQNVPLPIRGINLEPAISQPTTSTNSATTIESGPPADDWAEVEGEVFSRGVNQAAGAVDAARRRGATPADVRAITAHWDRHRRGWGQHAEAVLCRRLQRFAPGEGADDGWPAFDEAYHDELAATCRRAAARDAGREQLARREASLAERTRLIEERARDGLTLADLAAATDPELAAGIERARRRAEAADGAHRPRPP